MVQPKTAKLFPELGFGLGLRPDHYRDILDGTSRVSWFEALSENYMDEGGRPLHFLTKIRELKPVVLHGVSLSVAGTDPLNQTYLNKLKALVNRVEPAMVSDHCCWTGFNGQNLHDLMPVPFTAEALNHIADRVLAVQDFLKRRILIENVSSYVSFTHSEMTEWEFLAALSKRADCGLLLDVNNVYVSSVNHGFDPLSYIHGLPADRIAQIHLAGHAERDIGNGAKFLIDTHDHPVCDEVWSLYEKTVEFAGRINTMVEWDDHIPDYARLEGEVSKARTIEEAVLGKK